MFGGHKNAVLHSDNGTHRPVKRVDREIAEIRAKRVESFHACVFRSSSPGEKRSRHKKPQHLIILYAPFVVFAVRAIGNRLL